MAEKRVQAETILAAIQRIHEAPLTSDGWTRALPSIAAATQSDIASLLVQNAMSGADEFITGFELAPSHLAGFALAASAGKLPDWSQTLPVGVAIQSSSAMSDRDFMRSDFYNEAIRPMGSFYGLAVKPLSTLQRRVFLTTGRLLGRKDYNSGDLAAMQLLVPHIVTALHISRRLSAVDLRATGACAALDQLDTGVILVDATAKILFANRIAEIVLARNHGLGTEDGGLSARDRRANAALRQAIAKCADTSPGDHRPRHAIELRRGDDRPALRLTVAPFRPDAVEVEIPALGNSRPVAIILIADPEPERGIRKERLRREFGLTAAEADVALEILKGDGRDAAAARLGIMVATVRTHLIRIFEKTGVGRQAELVRLLLEDGTHIGGD
jgi:DNA-binding CsgD family transcriptional regulator